MYYSIREELHNLRRWPLAWTCREFVLALGRAKTYSITRNGYVIFGLLWGLPVPIFSVLLDIFASGRECTMPEFWHTFALRPIHLIFALHPFLFAVVFGAMGTIRYRKDAQIHELLNHLEENIEELNKANEQLKELDHMKRDFVANVTHELKTPLIAIQGYNEAISEGRFGPLNEKQKEGLQTALRNIDRLVGLIEELLDMSRIDSGKLHLEPVMFNIETAVRMILRSFEPQLKRKRIQADVQGSGEIAHVFADPEKIGRVLTNLISNAVKFTPLDGRVGVTLQPQSNGTMAITVWDTGCGIPEHLKTHIFERFWQADSSARKEYRGTGLGLAIVRGILDVHHAPVRVESEAGRGTRVTFELPLSDRRAVPETNFSSHKEVML